MIRYRLPSNPAFFVDLVDDEDVRLMIEEFQEQLGKLADSSRPGGAGRKLQICVEWRRTVRRPSPDPRCVAPQSAPPAGARSAEGHQGRTSAQRASRPTFAADPMTYSGPVSVRGPPPRCPSLFQDSPSSRGSGAALAQRQPSFPSSQSMRL